MSLSSNIENYKKKIRIIKKTYTNMKKIINFIKQKLFTTELLFSNEFCVNENALVINNFATDGFITQDGNNSAFHAVPIYKIREHEPLVVFEELISEIKKQIPKFDLDEILSGFFMFSGRRYTCFPCHGICCDSILQARQHQQNNTGCATSIWSSEDYLQPHRGCQKKSFLKRNVPSRACVWMNPDSLQQVRQLS